MSRFKAVILIAGAQKGTRFRPLSLDIPKPLFPVAGLPVIQHHIEALAQVQGLHEILILGFYPSCEMADFVDKMNRHFSAVRILYLQEEAALGTAGGIHHFRKHILTPCPEAFFVVNGDVCADFPLADMMTFHLEQQKLKSPLVATLLATEVTKQQSLNFGNVVENKHTHELLHYVEKPKTYTSSLINCGVYVFSRLIFDKLEAVIRNRLPDQSSSPLPIWLEKDVLQPLADTGEAVVFQTQNWWSQIKTAGAVIYANRHYLNLYEANHPERLASSSKDGPWAAGILGNVSIHPTAKIHPSAVLGPNVSIGPDVDIGIGCRIKESIVLKGSRIGNHSVVIYSVISMNAVIGEWTRVEGTPNDPNPNKPFATTDNLPLFNSEGKLNPSITIVGCNVDIPSEVILLNSVVLPNKRLLHSIKNEIVL